MTDGNVMRFTAPRVVDGRTRLEVGSVCGEESDNGDKSLLIMADSTRGGVGSVIQSEAAWFSERGWRVSVAAPGAESVSFPGVAHVATVPIPSSTTDINGLVVAARQLRRLKLAFHPAFFHCHGVRSLLAACGAGIRPVVTLHGFGKAPDESSSHFALRRSVLKAIPRIAREAVTAAPEFTGRWTFLAHASPRLASLRRHEFDNAGTKPEFLWLGRLEVGKRADLFVRAIAAASRSRDIQGVVAGDGTLLPSLKALAAKLDAPVRFAGHVDDVQRVMGTAHALVLTSAFEALAFAVQEAMWIGRSAIVSDLPGLNWLVGPTGVPVRDLRSLTDAIVLMCDSERARAMGSAAAYRIRSLMPIDSPWPQVEALITGVSNNDRDI